MYSLSLTGAEITAVCNWRQEKVRLPSIMHPEDEWVKLKSGKSYWELAPGNSSKTCEAKEEESNSGGLWRSQTAL